MPDSITSPPVHKIASEFRLLGWISFWVQVALALVSAGMLLLGFANLRNSPGAGGGLLFATLGLITLAVGAYRAYGYPRMGRQLAVADTAARPTRAETLKLLRRAILTNTVGLGLIIVGAESFAGILLFRAASQDVGMGLIGATSSNQLIKMADIFVVLANTHIIAAHFAAIAVSLWLVNRVAR